MSDEQYEYRLEIRTRWHPDDRGLRNTDWTEWSDGSGWNNKNGGVYRNLGAVKGV